MSIEVNLIGTQATDDELRIVELDQSDVADDVVASFSWVCWVDSVAGGPAEA